MDKDRNQELEKILSELNSNIKKNSAETAQPPVKKAVAETEAPLDTAGEKKESGARRRKPAIKPVEVVSEESSPKEPLAEEESPPAQGGTEAVMDSHAPASVETEGAAEPPDRKAPPKKPRKRPQGERLKAADSAESHSIGEFMEEERRSFLESARIIEDELEEPDPRQPAMRHIAVTAAEVVEEELPPEPPRRRKAFDQQKLSSAEAHVPAMPKRKRKRMSRREKTTAILGVIVTLFFGIGVVSTIVAGINVTQSLLNSTTQKEELARVIFPLVIVDIPEFDTPEALDNSAIIQSAIWAFIIDENDKSKYPKDDLGAMTVPDADIEPYIRRLYGNDVKIQHQSIDDASVQMLYDSENKRYIIESTPRFLPYTPRVDKIGKSGDIYILKVSYVLPDALWNLEKDHSDATVDKVMEYSLKRNKDSYQMLSVKLLEVTGRSEQGTESGAILPPEEDELSGEDALPVSSGEPAFPSSGASGITPAGDTSSEGESALNASEEASSGDESGSKEESSSDLEE